VRGGGKAAYGKGQLGYQKTGRIMALTETTRVEIDKAVRYFYPALVSVLVEQPGFKSLHHVFSAVLQNTGSMAWNSPNGRKHLAFARIAVQIFVDNGWIELIKDNFANDFAKANISKEEVVARDEQYADLSKKLERIGLLRGREFLASALARIALSFQEEDLTAYLNAMDTQALSLGGPMAQPPTALDDAPWEPLAIDRENPAFKEAVTVSEAALREIEGNNGYAVREPQERNGIVAMLKGAIAAIKEGSPSSRGGSPRIAEANSVRRKKIWGQRYGGNRQGCGSKAHRMAVQLKGPLRSRSARTRSGAAVPGCRHWCACPQNSDAAGRVHRKP
jgi:hypothetical protein